MTHQKYDIKGMTCSACSAAVERAVNKLEGINKLNVNLLSNSMSVDYDDNIVSNENIVKAVEDAGYQAFIHNAETKNKANAANSTQENVAQQEIKEMKKRLIISFIFSIPLFYISMGHMLKWPLPAFLHGSTNAIAFAFTQFLLVIPVIIVNLKYYRIGFKTLIKGSPNMDSLIAIGTSAAILYGIYAIYKIGYGLGHADMDMVTVYSMDLYFESAGVVLSLITLGKFFEARAKGKTSDAIKKLIDLAPKTATVIREEKELVIPIEDVQLNEIIIVKPGQSIPTDGIIIEGGSAIDESMLTGEPIPVEKGIGDKVIGASINKSGSFRLKATKIGNDTVLSQIIALVEEASSSKAPIARLADKISRVFVPIVISIAVIATIAWLIYGASFEFALSIGISVLVISCPCALGLATPTAIMVGTGKAAENGILIKSAEALETAHTIDTVVMDKTGTITEGKPRVTDIICSSTIAEAELIMLAASAEKNSEHPLAEAIIKEANKRSLQLSDASDFRAITGLGLKAKVNNKAVLLGNLKLMRENNIQLNGLDSQAEKLAENGKTPLFIADEKTALGLIAVADIEKATSAQAIKEFEAMGIEVIMLTGDNKKTAEAVRKRLNISSVIAEVLPQDKEKEIRRLQEMGKRVAMIGDGINDAPALARADVGIAIGAGTDVAIESADIVLIKNDLLDAVKAIQLSKAVIRNIKENLFWAFIYNSLGIPLAAGVFYSILSWKLNPMFAGAAMSFSSVSVVSNALRLKLFRAKLKYNNNNYYITNTNKIDGGNKMLEKIVVVDGMMCSHCTGRVEKALNAIEGVASAQANLETKEVTVKLNKAIENEVLIKAVEDAGYTVTMVK